MGKSEGGTYKAPCKKCPATVDVWKDTDRVLYHSKYTGNGRIQCEASGTKYK